MADVEGLGPVDGGPSDGQIRVVSYNIRFGGRGREGRLADVIVGLRPDVVILQEATDHGVVDRLGEATGLHVVRHPGHSVAALSRQPFRMAGWYRPPVGRSFLVLEPEGLGIRLIGVHLRAGLHRRGEGFRLREVEGLLDVAAAGGQNVAMIGDFNAVAPGDGPLVRRMPLWLRLILRFDGGIRTRAMGSLLEAGFVDVYRRLHPAAPGFTMPAVEPGVRLDYVIASPSVISRVVRCGPVPPTAGKPPASDHLPLVTDFAA